MVEESTVVSYGYEDEVMLLTEILPPRFMTVGQTVRFAAEARWLVCKNICLPASADLEFELRLTDEPPVPSARWESMFAETRSRLPIRADGLEMSASLNDDSIVLQINSTYVSGLSFEDAHFFASEPGVIAHGAPQFVTQEKGNVRIVLRKSQFLRPTLVRLTGVLVLSDLVDLEAGRTRALAVDAAVAAPAANEMDAEQWERPANY
jgi:thiol:disulfide interchange protein DsbD